jgi:GNAT superfamily N-acetyltransferase
MNVPLDIRRMGEADLAFADSLRALVGWNQTPADWARLLAHEPEGCFVAELEGRPAGTATTTRHGGGLAWIGMVLVHPDRRRHGIGRALLQRCIEHLDAVGCCCIKLDATPAGQPLYESLGFHDEWPLARWEGLAVAVDVASPRVRPYRSSDRSALLAADLEAFGVSRERLIENLLIDGTTLVAEEKGHIMGFGMLRPGSRAAYLGPIVARSTEAEEEIARALLARIAGQTVFWDIPEAAAKAVALAGGLGFQRQRPLTRMFRGKNDRPGIPARQFAIADPATG